MSDNAAMNRMFVSAARRGDRPMPGALARLAGSPTLDTDTPRSEKLNMLLSDREIAKEANDADALAFTDWRIDRLFEESRAAGKVAETEQAAEQPPPASWDGGVRERRPAPRPGLQQQETAASLFVRAMATSRQERIERVADEHTIRANI